MTLDPPPDLPPTAPRLRILHLVIWTGVTALLMVLIRFLNDSIGERGIPIPVSRQVLQLVYVLAVGPAVATLIAFPFWRRRGFRFPLHVGEWLSLVIALWFIHGVARSLMFSFTVREDPYAYSSFALSDAIGAVMFSGTSVCLLLAIWLNKRLYWRLFLLPLLCANVISATTASFMALGFMSSLNYDNPLWQLEEVVHAYGGVFLAAPVFLGAIVDLVRHRTLPWTHWVGIGCYLSYRLLAWIPLLLR